MTDLHTEQDDHATEGCAMIITGSSINFSTEHVSFEHSERTEQVTAWGNIPRNRPAADTGNPAQQWEIANREEPARDVSNLSIIGKQQPRHVTGGAEEIPPEEKLIADLNVRILKALIERLTGKKITVVDPAEILAQREGQMAAASHAGRPIPASTDTAGWGLIYDYRESFREYEKTTVHADGFVVTGDGQRLSIKIGLTMERSFFSEQQLSIRAGDALKDPLVINFDGDAAALSDFTFHFDLDRDGNTEQLRFVTPGGGFLAVDHNNDGFINDGGELFGALTGDGFAELRRYDDDGNGWIDEQDELYDRLRIWSVDEEGRQHLLALGQKGIGAIYLGHVSSPFSLKDGQNNLQGQVRTTGVFLFENGSAGTIQQIDLVV